MSVLQVDTIQDSAGTTNKELAQYSSGNWSWGAGVPTGSLVKTTIKKLTSGSVNTTTTDHTAVFNYQEVTCTAGNTIVYDISFGGEATKNTGTTAQRIAAHKLYQSTSSVSAGATSSLGTQLNFAYNGRTLTGATSSGADGFFFMTFRAVFEATATSHYFGLSHACLDTTAAKVGTFITSDRPIFISVTEFKGDVLT